MAETGYRRHQPSSHPSERLERIEREVESVFRHDFPLLVSMTGYCNGLVLLVRPMDGLLSSSLSDDDREPDCDD